MTLAPQIMQPVQQWAWKCHDMMLSKTAETAAAQADRDVAQLQLVDAQRQIQALQFELEKLRIEHSHEERLRHKEAFRDKLRSVGASAFEEDSVVVDAVRCAGINTVLVHANAVGAYFGL